MLFTSTICIAQKQNVYFLKNNGTYVEKRDSADYIRIVREPDSASTLYNVAEFYLNGKRRLVGKSITVDPPKFEGQCLTYFPNGTKKTVTNFSNGNRLGTEYYFYPNGKPYLVKEFADDKQPDGYFREYLITACYDSLGTTLLENGNGHAKLYDEDFKAVYEAGPVKSGKHDGEWKGYDKRQKAAFTETYNGGQLVWGTAKYDDSTSSNYSKSRGTQPQFKGGVAGFGSYLGNNIRYPDFERKNGIEGRVILSFTVEKDGTVTDIKVTIPVSPGLDEEALRVLKKSPHWVTGTLYGKPVKVKYAVPVNFKLTN